MANPRRPDAQWAAEELIIIEHLEVDFLPRLSPQGLRSGPKTKSSSCSGTTPNAASSQRQAAPAPAPPRDVAAATSAAMDDAELEAYIERIEQERATTPTSSTAKAQTDHAQVSDTTDQRNTNYANLLPGAKPPPLTPGELNRKAAAMPTFASPGATPPPLNPGDLNTKYAGMPAFMSPGATPPPLTLGELNTRHAGMPAFVSPGATSPPITSVPVEAVYGSVVRASKLAKRCCDVVFRARQLGRGGGLPLVAGELRERGELI